MLISLHSSLSKFSLAQSLFLMLFLYSYTPQAQATIVIVPSLEIMTQKSEVIVHARVYSQKTIKENGRILTLTEIEVIEAIKGAQTGEILVISQLGGEFEGQRTQVVGNYKLETEEEMFFFGVKHKTRLIGYGIGVGKFKVERLDNGTKVIEDFGDVMAIEDTHNKAFSITAPKPRHFKNLQIFKQEIQMFVKQTHRLKKKQTLQKQEKMLPYPLLREQSIKSN